MAIQKEKNEELIAKHTLYYLSPDGQRYQGRLVLTNLYLHFDADFEIDHSAVSNIQGGFKIPVSAINDVAQTRHMLVFHRLAVQTKDFKEHWFDCGATSPSKLCNAIKGVISA